jgi:peptide/nickel transport system substrate-binding protein
MERKNSAIGIVVIAALVASGVYVAFSSIPTPPEDDVVLVVGTKYGPIDLDPQVAWDSASIDTIDQVCEGLFAYNLSDPDSAIIPNLALSGTWNPAATEFTVILREGVTFHDGAPFNADAVIFTWDRMSWALNTNGTNTDEVTQVAELYEFPDGTPIVASITKNGDYSVTFNLAGPYVPFKALLCFSASYILSPLSTPATAYIDTATGDIVGTGPFVYDGYKTNIEVSFHAYKDYWQERAQVDKLVFSVIIDENARHTALFSGDIHILLDPNYELHTFINAIEGIVLEEGPQSTVIQYLCMNNLKINRTFREAISHAINYDYLIDELRLGNALRMKSPIPKGIKYANWSFNAPTYNLTHAREAMQSMGFGNGFNNSDDSEWINQTNNAPFSALNYTYILGNEFRENVLIFLQENLEKIGIEVLDDWWSWDSWHLRMGWPPWYDNYNYLNLYWNGWGPDFNDPNNFINPLFTNRSTATNLAQYNGWLAAIEAGDDPHQINNNVQLLMEAALEEVNSTRREKIYDRIQELLIERDFPWVFGYVNRIFSAYASDLRGYHFNPIGKEYYYPCYFA